jgi:hypothetical protein
MIKNCAALRRRDYTVMMNLRHEDLRAAILTHIARFWVVQLTITKINGYVPLKEHQEET